MSSAVQRQSFRIDSPRVAPIGGQQFGLERGTIRDTPGGISPLGGPVSTPDPVSGLGGGLGGDVGPLGGGLEGLFDGNGPISLGLPLTRLELGSMLRPRMNLYE